MKTLPLTSLTRFRRPPSPFPGFLRYKTTMPTRKFDFDYNYDPAGTSLVTPDPYTEPPPKDEENYNGSSISARQNTRLPMYQARARSPTRSPSPPLQLEPTPEYLAVSQEPTSKLDDVSEQRKLLILDLNGTLVFRSPHTKRNAYQLRGVQRPLRSVHRRPYLGSFTEYLFHPGTRTWLDTMVWSSAQPHSVADMTDQCFPSRKDDLVAIWARDTLGLKQEDYHRKTQTTKDLAKPWADPKLKALGHSARSTLLLDDSPLKAHLQPWNHLCIKEYVSEMRKTDVKVREAERLREIQDEGEEEQSGKRKGAKKAQKFADRVAQAEAEAVGEDGRPLEYDGTLLAVVGILDATKEERNVAAWMRTGHLVDVPVASRSGTPSKKRRNTGEHLPSSPAASEGTSSPPPSDSSTELQEATGVPLTESKGVELWFDHPNTFGYWVQRGRRALEELGIEVKHGIIGANE